MLSLLFGPSACEYLILLMLTLMFSPFGCGARILLVVMHDSGVSHRVCRARCGSGCCVRLFCYGSASSVAIRVVFARCLDIAPSSVTLFVTAYGVDALFAVAFDIVCSILIYMMALFSSLICNSSSVDGRDL